MPDEARATATRHKEAVARLFHAIEVGDMDAVDELVAEDYIHHDPGFAGGREPIKELYRSMRGSDFDVYRALAEGDLVGTHTHVKPPSVADVDIFRFGADGRIVEHWGVIQPVQRTASGNTMFDGGGDPDTAATAEQVAANGALVARLYEIERAGDADRLGEVVAEDCIEHDPGTPSGLAAIQSFIRQIGPVDLEIMHTVAQGDLVLAHYGARGVEGADIFRLAGGKVAEHWSVLQESGGDAVA